MKIKSIRLITTFDDDQTQEITLIGVDDFRIERTLLDTSNLTKRLFTPIGGYCRIRINASEQE